MEYTGGSPKADHLCVLVHGLWGNPSHMKSVAKAIRTQYSTEELYLLVAKRNAGSFTYDGIELGGERVCLEIEETLREVKSKGGKITKISFVGYSLGGLVARYAIGLLGANGFFNEVEPVNFTTFASPHLGARTPLRGLYNRVFNTLGARTLSTSGRQLFGVDDFRETGRPLLAILADPDSIFISALGKFKRRTLYANVVNDRTAAYYTTIIAKTDPYVNVDKIKANYVKGYEDVILDPLHPVTPLAPRTSPTTLSSIAESGLSYAKNAPIVILLAAIIPVGVLGFLINSVIQTLRSSKRIQLHEKGLAGIQVESYRVPFMTKRLREAVEDVYENINSSQQQEYLSSSSDDDDGDDHSLSEVERQTMSRERRESQTQWPTLALTPHQFDMISALDNVGWRKYPVWIHKHRHSHAAIIVRGERSAHAEGYLVLKHWVQEEFLIR